MIEKAVDQRIQDYFVVLCITDTKFLSTARRCINPEYFGSTISEKLVELCYNYFDKFGEAPDNHFIDEVEVFLDDVSTDKAELFITYLNRINSLELPSQTYILSRISEFIKAREFRKAALSFVKLAEEGDFDTAKENMTAALKVGAQMEEEGLNYFNKALPTWLDTDEGEELINLGVPILGDKVLLKRKQVVCILGGGKGKKSWWLQWLTRVALLQGLRVLYISHELTIPEVEMRFDMMNAKLVSRKVYENVTFTRTDSEGQVVDSVVQKIGVLANNISKVKKARRGMKMFGGSLIIKKYPMKVCTIGELERYIDYLEVFENWVPDILVNDYPTIMKLPLPKADKRDRIDECYAHHKRIADERNILVLTACQANRAGLEKAHLSKKNIAEDIRILANTDMIIAVSQTPEMERINQMRVYVMSGRSEQDNFGCLVSQNIPIGQVVVDSWWPKENEYA